MDLKKDIHNTPVYTERRLPCDVADLIICSAYRLSGNSLVRIIVHPATLSFGILVFNCGLDNSYHLNGLGIVLSSFSFLLGYKRTIICSGLVSGM